MEAAAAWAAGDALAMAVSTFLAEPTTANREALHDAQTAYRAAREWA